MEIHQHTHTPRKKWTHYFWEFLMLFLAVFCGFLAEYQLEHTIEHNREKQYALSMLEDLKSDTAALNRVILLRTRRNEVHDSLFLLLNERRDSTDLSRLYYLSFLVGRLATLQFINNDRTIQQLKNSGALRLIRKRVVSDSIIMYDRRIRQLEKIQEREEEARQNFHPCLSRIFDGRIYYRMLTENDRIQRPDGNPALLQYSKEDLNTFNISLTRMKSSNIAARAFSNALYDKAVSVMNTIKKEYHLK
jgi:hypothetical protein